MQRAAEQIRSGRRLHNLPGIHHGQAVGDVADDAEIVRDEQHGHAEALLEVEEQFKNLRLNGHVERGRRLVGDEQLRLGSESHRDHDALLHPAGELVRIIFEPRFRRGNADQFQQADDFGVVGLLGAVELERFLDLIADAEDRIQRRARVLKNIADHAAANLPQLGLVHLQHVAAVQENLAAHVTRRRRRHEPRDGERGHAFAATALAHEADGLARINGEGHAVHGAQRLILRAELQLEVFDFEQGHSGMTNDE